MALFRNVSEVIGRDELEAKLKEGNGLRGYIGTAPTGPIHVGYMGWVLKVADLVKQGVHMTVLLADLHALLDNMKSTWDRVALRATYYERVLKALFKLVGLDSDAIAQHIHFVRGTTLQLQGAYTLDMYKLAAMLSMNQTKHASSDVVKHNKQPLMSGLLYPILQALDEQYLNVDFQLGGLDQRKIFMFARENLPKLGYAKRAYLMTPLIPGLTKSGKMSASIPNSKIDFTDSDEAIAKKVSKTFSVDRQPKDNALLAMLRWIVFPWLARQNNATFTITLKYGITATYGANQYGKLETDFSTGVVYSADLKPALTQQLCRLVAPIRKLLATKDNVALLKRAYSNQD